MPRVKRSIWQEIGMLKSALMQKGWEVEYPDPTSILDFQIKETVLTLELQCKVIEAKIRRVCLEGQLGIPCLEPRRFMVSFYSHLPRKLVFVRSKDAPPGWPMKESPHPYGFSEHARRYGNGENLLRAQGVAQPRVLQAGDMLATGEYILSPPRQGCSGSVLIHLTGGVKGLWIEVASRLPIALFTP